MLIQEVCQKTKLTKKAIEYYESKELVQPDFSENGYRNYEDKDVNILKEISLLRKLGLGISEIKSVLNSSNKRLALSKIGYMKELNIKKFKNKQDVLRKLAKDYDIDKMLHEVNTHQMSNITIIEKLVDNFPGYYGLYLSVYFGSFLNDKIETPEKEDAYQNIIDYLDNIDFTISKELEVYFDEALLFLSVEDMEKLNKDKRDAIENWEEYLQENKEQLLEYLEYRSSEEYKSSTACQLQKLIIEFQKKSGYYEIFITNLKVLSNTYCEYIKKMEEVNKKFIEGFPQCQNWDI